MAYCTNCGTPLKDDARFCPGCGAPCGSASCAQNGKTAPDATAPEETGAKALSALAYVHWILIIVAVVAMPKSKLCRFHANQALVLFLAELIVSVALTVVYVVASVLLVAAFIPDLSANAIVSMSVGSICLAVLAIAVSVTSLVFTILGIVYGAQGKCKPLPLIGKFHIIK